MASVYRFTRKSKKEDPENSPEKIKQKQSEDFFPLLFAQTDKTPVAEKAEETVVAPEESTAEETKPEEEAIEEASPAASAEETEEADLAATREVNLEEKAEAEDFDPMDQTRTFEPFAEEAPETPEVEKTREIPEELLEALRTPQVDEKKLEEVFFHTRGTVSAGTTKEEYDQTTALLMEVFGTEQAKKKKKKKEAADPALTEEIHGIFSESKSLQEALAELPPEGEVPSEEKKDDYVAVHDGEDESTKEYHATFSIEEALSQITPEPVAEEENPPKLAEEVRVSESDNLYSDTYDELDTKIERGPVLPEEFTADEEFDEFAEHLRGRNYKTMVSVFWSLLVFAVLFYLESATFSRIYHPEILRPDGIYGTIFLLLDIQLILLSALPCLSSLLQGAKGIFTAKPNRSSMPFLLTLFALIHAGSMIALGAKEYPLFGCVAAFFSLMTCIANTLDAKRIHRSFRICGKRGEKLAAEEVDGESAEAEAFREILEGEPRFFSVQKTGFIDGFFRRATLPSRAERSYLFTLIAALLLCAGFAVYSHVKTPDLALTFSRFMTAAVMVFPMSGIFTVVLPFSHLSRKAAKKACAIVSAADADYYAESDVVSFTDKEIFPPRSVKVSTIRTYGQTRIDKAILYAAMVFQKLGGPLSLVFKKTISGVCDEIPEDFDFREITADGLCAHIEDKDVFVGNKNYLLSYDFGYTKDEIDESFEANSGKIMYMVIGTELAAKFYIRYSISSRFKKTVHTLFKAGICPAVKTCDPNIDADLFRSLLQNDKIPAGIVKTCEAMKDAPMKERSESGIVCTSTIANLLTTFSLCDSLKHLSRANVVMAIVSMVLGAGIVAFLFFIGSITKITALFALIYQLLWLIPVIIPSLSE